MKKILLITTLLIILWSLFAAFSAWAGYKIEVSIPGGPTSGESVTLTQYIRYLYLFGLGAVGIAALGVLVTAGFRYMLSDTIDSKDEAKKMIQGALSGLVLALAAYLILNTINPDLVKLKKPETTIQTQPPTDQKSEQGQCIKDYASFQQTGKFYYQCSLNGYSYAGNSYDKALKRCQQFCKK
jgi:hypothetical protein